LKTLKQRTVHFDTPSENLRTEYFDISKTKTNEFQNKQKLDKLDGNAEEKIKDEEKNFYEPRTLFSNPPKDFEEENSRKKNNGYYSLRKNYQVNKSF
jgi:hypothetical protein